MIYKSLTITVLCALTSVCLAGKTPAPTGSEYPGAKWVPASSRNFTASRRPSTYPINYWVNHVVQGSYASCVSWFQNSSAAASTHFVARSSDGEITQMVLKKDVAWHAGNWDYNCWSLGIEHEGFISDPTWFTGKVYDSSANLLKWAAANGTTIQKDRAHVIGHTEVPGCASGNGGGSGCHTDPGQYWNWDFYMARVNPPAGTNLARSAVAFQESGHNASDQAADKLYDGNYLTKWCEVSNPNAHWAAIDLGAAKSINTFIVGHASLGAETDGFNAKEFYLYTADSFSGPWTERAHVVNAGSPSANVVKLGASVSARCVKILVTNSGALDPYVRMPELEVWGN